MNEYASRKYIELPVREDCLLIDFLLKQMGLTHTKVKNLLSGGAVTVDRKAVSRHDTPLQRGQLVHVTRHKRNNILENRFVKIIYEDRYLVVIEKGAGILSMASSARQYCVKTVLDEYFEKRHFKCRAHVVHRLDRDTSGLMLYAKDVETAQVLEHQWKEFVYDRRYVALLSGHMEQEGGTVHNWLKDNKAYITYSSPTDNGGKEAITHYRRLMTTEDMTLCEMKLDTGRKNQIRVHMADIGHPVCGDDKYGNGHNPARRLALHAYRLYFIHPVTGEDMHFETAFPKEFTRFFS